jgi:hypothetical protein
MKQLTTILTFVFATLFAYAQEEITNKITAEHVTVKGTKVSLIPPPGFTKATSFTGFQQTQDGLSIMVNEIPGPYEEIVKGLTPEAFKTKGVTIQSKEVLVISSQTCLLYIAEQEAQGYTYSKLMLVFGDHKSTIMINGMCLKVMKDELAAIKKSILSMVYNAKLEVKPEDRAVCEVDVTGTKLKAAKSMSAAMLYSVDGNVPTKSSDKTSFIVAPSLGEGYIGDHKLFAIQRIEKLPMTSDLKIESTIEVTIASMKGYEIIAYGIDDNTGKKALTYQVMLFKGNQYYLMIGKAKDDFPTNLELFKKISKTFKVK